MGSIILSPSEKLAIKSRPLNIAHKRSLSARKVWYAIFFSNEGVAIKVPMEKGENITAKYYKDVQEVFHVYLNKFEIVASHLFLIKFSKNKFTLVYQISRNAQSPRQYLFTLFVGFKQSLKMSSQNLSV